MRLYDRLCVEQPRPCFGDDPFILDGDFFDCTVFDIQQVADYFFSLTPITQTESGPAFTVKAEIVHTAETGTAFSVQVHDYYGFSWDDLGCVIPSYEQMFCEFQAPDSMQLHNERKGKIPVGKVGCYMERIDRDELEAAPKGLDLISGLVKQGVPEDDLGFFVDIRAFADKPGNGGLMGPVVSWGLPLSREGRMFLYPDDSPHAGQPIMIWKPPISLYSYDDQVVTHFAQVLGTAIIVPALMALSVLHTPQEEEWHLRERQEPNRAIARKWARRHGRPLVSYYVLEVGGVKRRMTEGGHRTMGEVLRALHKVRGHPRYYKTSYFGRKVHPNGKPISPENPLVVFVPEHTRGSAEAGKRDKDYAVVKEAEQS